MEKYEDVEIMKYFGIGLLEWTVFLFYVSLDALILANVLYSEFYIIYLYATSPKVAGSISDEVTGFFN
jgi:hypothetical protein